MTAIPATEWLQDTTHKAYDALKLGPVEVAVMRTDDDALIQVRLLKQKNHMGACATSVFRMKAGRGDVKSNFQREVAKAARRLERAIWEETHRKLDG